MLAENESLKHPVFARRTAIQAGTVGLLGLGMNHLCGLRAAENSPDETRARSVIFIFCSGGLAQHDTFDMKPAARDVCGEFKPISTTTPGLQICEHLPLLAQRSQHWSLVRSLTHPHNGHTPGHMTMLTGRSELPPGFNPRTPKPTDWPGIAAVAKAAMLRQRTALRGNLPPTVILPELLRNDADPIPGQVGGAAGAKHDPWVVAASPAREGKSWGAYPTYAFHHHTEALVEDDSIFEAPNLSLPEGIGRKRFTGRIDLVKTIDQQRQALHQYAEAGGLDRMRQRAVSLLSDRKVKWALDVTRADTKTLDRYGRNSFGWSLLMARRLVEVGVSLVQVNLGNSITWDTHGSNFIKLRDWLLPPTDLALSALLDDLSSSGLLEETLIVMCSEFGRTPRIYQCCPDVYERPGRGHWGAVQSVLLAGGGVRGGNVIGASDRIGAYPELDPQRPENLAATIYDALGIPRTAVWHDAVDRPHHVYHGSPIPGLV